MCLPKHNPDAVVAHLVRLRVFVCVVLSFVLHLSHALTIHIDSSAPSRLKSDHGTFHCPSTQDSSAWHGSACHVSPVSLYVARRFNTTASLSYSDAILAFCTSLRFSFRVSGSHSRSSPPPATATSSPSTTHVQISGFVPECTRTVEVSRPMCAPSSCTRCCRPAAARRVPYMNFFKRQHRSVSRKCGGFTCVLVNTPARRIAPFGVSSYELQSSCSVRFHRNCADHVPWVLPRSTCRSPSVPVDVCPLTRDGRCLLFSTSMSRLSPLRRLRTSRTSSHLRCSCFGTSSRRSRAPHFVGGSCIVIVDVCVGLARSSRTARPRTMSPSPPGSSRIQTPSSS